MEEDGAARRARLKALRAAADAKAGGGGSAAAEAPVGAMPKTKLANPLLDGPSTSQPAGGFYSDPMAQYETPRDFGRVALLPGPPGPPGVPLPPPPGPPRFGAGTRFPPPPPRAAPPGRGGRGGPTGGGRGHPASWRGDDRGRKRDRDDRNMDAYVSKSMVEDPWRHLTTTR